jgi:hypothetical protein
MNYSMRCLWMIAGCLALGSNLSAYEPASPIATLMTERGKLVLQENFDQPPDKKWKLVEPVWETVDGALRATHRKPFPANHGPVMQYAIALDNAVVQVSFKLEETARMTLHFNKKNGHLCRTNISTKAFYVIRRDSGGDKGIRLDERETPIQPNVWHTLVMEVCGTEMLASLDGKEVIFGTRDDLNQPKTMLILEAAAGTAWFKDLRVWEAVRNKNWDATKTRLLAERKRSADKE